LEILQQEHGGCFILIIHLRFVDGQVPVKALQIDGNCRVEDRGLKTHHGQMVYVLCIYNKKEKENHITMGAHDIEDALVWKKKLELLIDQV
jgi:hypothetical protein